MPNFTRNRQSYYWLWFLTLLLLYGVLTGYQLGLPGLHYDEAREAGLNAIELLTGAPVTAFRQATVSFFGWQVPLMVQDYIGAANVYFALPVLALTGIGVPNLRFIAILTGLATLLLLERTIQEWMQFCIPSHHIAPTPRTSHSVFRIPYSLSAAGLLAITLLVVSPSFVFWSRQGVFVTNLTQPLVLWALWHGLRWLRVRRLRFLLAGAFATGAAIYAKLLAVWILAPFAVLAFFYYLWIHRHGRSAPIGRMRLLGEFLLALFFLLLPLTPLLLFNWQTGGTFRSVGSNYAQSYYGVSNFDLTGNLLIRWQQLVQVLRGDQFLYLGDHFANWLAPWLAGAAILLACWRNWRLMLPPIVLLAGAFFASLFTVSGLFVTHYALLQPLLVALVGCAAWVLLSAGVEFRAPSRKVRGTIIAICFLLWFCFDLTNTIRYHRSLSQSGGRGDHTDATYHLAYHLRHNGLGAPIALDWGIDATVRYLSEGTVQPIEIFGYESLQQPDDGYIGRLEQFLDNPNNVYLLRSPSQTVFAGRREQFLQLSGAHGLIAQLEQQFTQRDGTPIFELWRVAHKQ